MNIDMEYYKVFCVIAECGNFSKAAEKLYISQPAITQTIKKLEDQLECKLFYRKSNGVCLTKEGENLYNYIKSSITTINNVENKFNEFRGLKSGSIKIKTGSNNARRVLYDSLIAFSKDYPNIKIQISQGKPQDSINELIDGKIDMVILNLPYKNLNNMIELIEIVENTYIFVVEKEYLNKNNIKIKNVEDLEKYPLIIPMEGSTARNILNIYLNKNEVNYRYEIVSEHMRKDFAMQGLGIAYVMKYLVEQEIREGKLIELKLNKKLINSKVGVAILKDNIASFASRKLIEYMKNNKNS